MQENNSKLALNIDQILLERSRSVDEAQKVVEHISRLKSVVNDVDEFRIKLLKQNSLPQIQAEELKGYSFSTYIDALNEELIVWNNLLKRFQRSTINIGVIGIMGQGKSTFLQRITHLSDDEIPARKGPACTSAQSILYHSPNDPHAKVHFYTEQEFLDEIIAPYFNVLKVDLLEMTLLPLTIDELSKKNFKSPDNELFSNATKASWYKSFYDIFVNLQTVKSVIQDRQEGGNRVSLNEIKNYIQYHYDDKNNPVSFEYLAVKKVEIFCAFKNSNAHKLGLIDIPGLGDTKLGDVERMVRTIGEDTDLILLIKKLEQRAEWGTSEISIYDTAASVLKDKLPLELWSYIFINNALGDIDECRRLKSSMPTKSRMKVIDCLIADFMVESEVIAVLDEAIDYLVKNIRNIDRILIEKSKLSLKSIETNILANLLAAGKAIKQINFENIFDTKFDAFFKTLRIDLHALRLEIKAEGDKTDSDFENEIKKIIAKCKSEIELPTEREFIEKGIENLSPQFVWDTLIHHIRCHILRYFHQLDTKQQYRVIKRKEEIAKCLTSETLLGPIAQKYNKEGAEFLLFFNGVLSELLPNSSGLIIGFDFINTFKFSYQGYVQNVVYNTISGFFSTEIRRMDDVVSKNDLKVLFDTTKLTYEKLKNAPNLLGVKSNEISINKIIELSDKLSKQESIKGKKEHFQVIDSLLKIGNSLLSLTQTGPTLSNVMGILEHVPDLLSNNASWMVDDLNDDMSLKNLEERIDRTLSECEQRLIESIGNWPEQVSRAMTEEFIDHIAFTLESKSEWKFFLRQKRQEVWSEFDSYEYFNRQIVEFQQRLDNVKQLVYARSGGVSGYVFN